MDGNRGGSSAEVVGMLRPDAEAMRAHIEHVFGGYSDVEDGRIELAWTDAEANASGRYPLRHAATYSLDNIDDLIAKACNLNAIARINVYIGAALRDPDTAPFGRCQDPDFYAATAYWCDLDDKDANDRAKERWADAPPSMVVCTGTYPHWRHQLWWRLTEAVTSPEQVSGAVNGISQIMGGDGTVSNPSRVMRLAGSIAWDQKPDRRPELTKIIFLKKPGLKAYLPEHVERVFPPLFKLTQVRDHRETRAAPGPNVGVVRERNTLGLSTGKVVDGREKHMTAVIMARLIDWCGRYGAEPTVDDLVEHAWDSYEQSTDLVTRPGRGRDEFVDKCRSTIRRFEAGKIRGCQSLEQAVEAYQTRREAKKASYASVAQDDEADDFSSQPDPESSPIKVSDLCGEPPTRPWLVDQWVPAGVVSAIYGDGGVGKTLLAQQLLYAAGVGGKWLGLEVPKMRGLGVFCEDDGDELHRRHNSIKTSLGFAVGNPFDETWIWPRVGFDNLLVTFDRDNRPTMSPFFQSVMRHVLEKRVGLLVLDTVADLFGGNEIIRGQVTFFIKSVCGSFIRVAAEDGFVLTVILLAHPSQTGRNSGSGESGSTAWNNSVRSRLYLTKPEDGGQDDRQLTRKKSNYAASGDETALDLVWRNGVIIVRDKAFTGWPEKDVCRQILAAIHDGWTSKKPWSMAPQTKQEGRFAPRRLNRGFGVSEATAANMLETWLENEILAVETCDAHRNLKGLRVVGSLD